MRIEGLKEGRAVCPLSHGGSRLVHASHGAGPSGVVPHQPGAVRVTRGPWTRVLFACFLSCCRTVTTTPCPPLSVVKTLSQEQACVWALPGSVGAPHPLPCGNSGPREPVLGGLTVGCTAFGTAPFCGQRKRDVTFFGEKSWPRKEAALPMPRAPMVPTDPSAVASWGTPPPASSLSLGWSVGGSGGLKSPKTTGHSGVFTDLVRGSLSRHTLLAFSLGLSRRVERGAFQDVDEAELC